MSSADVAGHACPTLLPPRKRVLALSLYDHAAAEERQAKRARPADDPSTTTSSQQQAGALVTYVAPPADAGAGAEPINAVPLAVRPPTHSIDAVPLAAVAPQFERASVPPAEPAWIRRLLLSRLGLRFDLPVHFIDEKTVTNTDLDSHQNRFRLPSDGVQRRLRAMLTPEEVAAASLSDECAAPRRRLQPKQQQQPAEGEGGEPQQAGIRKKTKGRKHGGLPVVVVDLNGGLKTLELTRWESSGGTVIKGEGYLDFIGRCGYTENDVVQIWAFKQREFRHFGVVMCEENPLYMVLVKIKDGEPQPRLAAAGPRPRPRPRGGRHT